MKMKGRSIILIVCIMLSCVLAGCKSEKTTEDSTKHDATSKPLPTETAPTEAVPTEAAPTGATPTEAASTEATPTEAEEGDPKVEDHRTWIDLDTSDTYYGPDPDLKDFSQLSNCFKDYDFNVTSDINHEKFISTYGISGEYDLNGDGINESIEAVLSNDYKVDSYVMINDIRVELYTDNPTGEVEIIDLDSNDNYLELACFDDGPSGDPHYKLFRYNGEKLIILKELDSGTIMDGRGKFISWFSLATDFKPQFYTSWYELVDNDFIHRDHDVSQYIGKTYELSSSAYFVPLDEVPEDYSEYMSWDFEYMRDFEATPVKILDISYAKELFIELEDGQKGLLYFWIGD